MIAIGHTSVGVILGVAVAEVAPENLPLIVAVLGTGALGVASHYAMDLVPHGHYDMNLTKPSKGEPLKLVVDLVIPIGLVGLFLLINYGFGPMTWLVGAGVAGAQLPDVLMGLHRRHLLPKWAWLQRESAFHSNTHWHNPKDPAKATNEGGRRLGLSDIWQAGVIVVALLMLLSTG